MAVTRYMFKIFNGTLIEYKSEKNETEIVIPDNITIISQRAFSDCKTIKSVRLSKNITRIEASAFSGCSSLEYILLSDKLEFIGERAFYACTKLKEIRFPDSLSSIGSHAFYGCKQLEKLHFPQQLIEIGDRAFMVCINLQEVYFSNNLNTIGMWAFANTPWLESKRKENPLVKINRTLIDGYKFSGTLMLTNDITDVSKAAFSGNKNIEKVILYSEKYEIRLNISSTDDIETIIKLVNTNENQQRIMLEQIDDELLKTQISMYLAFGKYSIVGEEYLKNNIISIAKNFIKNNDSMHFNDILNSKYITEDNISEIISYASDENQTEIKSMLLEYKNKVIGFKNVHDRFRL